MSEGSFVDYYELLGVPTDAEAPQIRAAFLRLAKEHHPDVGGSTEQMQQFSKAYQTLGTESKRKAYDLLHDFHVGHAQVKYHEAGAGRDTDAIDDLSDDEIDEFLDTLYEEYRNAPPKMKPSVRERLSRLFEF